MSPRHARDAWIGLAVATLLAGSSLLTGCDGDEDTDAGSDMDAGALDAGPPPDAGPPDAGWRDVTLYTPVTTLTDDELADQAVAIMVGSPSTPRCTTCHGLLPTRVSEWGTETSAALDCIGSLEPNLPADAQQVLDCFIDPMTGMADPATLGFVATATHLDWFQRVFEVVYEDSATTEREIFLMTGNMPQDPGVDLTQDEVDILLTWASRGLPGMDTRLADEGGLDCELRIDPEVSAHIARMETEGWAVRNRDASIAMFGCGAGETGADCLSTFPLATDSPEFAEWDVVGTSRILYEYTDRSSYWTKSSADGRFVAMGGGPGAAGPSNSTIIDLETSTAIATDALYDPGFLPDNSGFVFQGTSRGIGFCRQSLLYAEPARVTFGEPECDQLGNAVGLYQHVARIADGDYWTVFGQFVSDNGGHMPRRSYLPVAFDNRSAINLVPVIDEGTAYTAGARIRLDSPFEGDTVMAPSGRLLMSRARGMGGVPAGYVLRAMNPTATPTGYTAEIPEIGRYCGRGGKVAFSYDERWVVFHRYITDDDATSLGFIGVADPAFADYRTMGGSNVYLLDLFSGVTRRVTHMAPGQYALFPHFRSDGWIYFQVRASVAEGSTRELIVASDAALVQP